MLREINEVTASLKEETVTKKKNIQRTRVLLKEKKYDKGKGKFRSFAK